MRPYQHYCQEDLILRDYLAIDRTILANERTFLAYIRTALAISAAGASFIKFFESLPMTIIGWAMVPVGIIVLLIGVRRYRQMQVIVPLQKQPPSASADDTPRARPAGNA